MNSKKVWFITGASKGLGLSLVKKLLGQNYKVAATSRDIHSLKEAVGDFDPKNFLPLEVNLMDEESVKESLKFTIETFGKLDVIVNNAGYGIGGTIEELSKEEVTESFNVNVFATMNVIKFAMPYLRKQRSGNIINISSIAGFAPTIGWSVYAAAKHAVIGLSEVLAEDVKSFGIKVTVVAPGAFRTQFLSKESLVLAKETIEDYKDVQDTHKRYLSMDGLQLGNPEKAAQVFIDLAESENPPVRLYLGSDSFKRATAKIELLSKQKEEWKEISFSTDFTE